MPRKLLFVGSVVIHQKEISVASFTEDESYFRGKESVVACYLLHDKVGEPVGGLPDFSGSCLVRTSEYGPFFPYVIELDGEFYLSAR